MRLSTAGDHIFSREFFQVDQRDGLPQVPSCELCNNKKSKLEHYLTATLPFGATHSNAKVALTEDVPKRLKKNKKLKSQLESSFAYKEFRTRGSDVGVEPTVNIDFDKVHELVGFVGRGLMWYHWKTYLPKAYSFLAFTPSAVGVEYLTSLSKLSSTHRVDENLGGDVVRYKGSMSDTDNGVSVWGIQLLGGMTISDSGNNVFENSFVAMITGPSKMLSKINREIGL